MRWIRRIGVIAAVVILAPLAALAQTIGTFRWQTQPYCNVISVAVTQTGAAYRLEGTDDGCEITNRSSVIGMAFANPDGSIGGGLTVIAGPGGIVLHIDVTILPASGYSGSWRDSAGRSGTFLFAPAAIEGAVRPHVLPSTPFGIVLAQPPGGGDRALSATVATDTGTPNDAAAIYGRYGVPLAPGLEGPAGVRGESDANAGVYGRTASGIGVVGGAHNGIGVQGHGVTVGSTGVQAHSVHGGTALEINNGAIKVAGAVRAAFRHIENIPGNTCALIDHPLTNGDINVLLFVIAKSQPLATYVQWFQGPSKWAVCSVSGASIAGVEFNVLVIKQ